MKTAISIWDQRVSPVFDSSRRLLLLDIEDGKVLSREEREFRKPDPVHKLAELAQMKVQVLIKTQLPNTRTVGVHRPRRLPGEDVLVHPVIPSGEQHATVGARLLIVSAP